MALRYPTEPEKQEIIDSIHRLQPSYGHIERVCRLNIKEHPHDVYPQSSTLSQAISALVDRAVQKGTANLLIAEFESTISGIDLGYKAVRPIDSDLGDQFGRMFTSLLQALEKLDEQELEQYTADIDKADLTDFKDKLENKAKFSKDIQVHALSSRREISVLQRLSKKLGYSKYGKLKRKVVLLYFRICDEYPTDQHKADFRYQRLLEYMYEQLPKEIRQQYDECLENLTGVIFDSAYDCYIFNE